MRIRLFAAAAACFLLAYPLGATAAEPKAKGKAEPPAFELKPIGFPVVVNGELVNYVFVIMKLTLKPGQDPVPLHSREPYLRDLLVRQGSRVPFNRPNDTAQLDDVRLKAAVLDASRTVLGVGVATSVQIVSETPQHVGPQ